jgi:hypothetical protein
MGRADACSQPEATGFPAYWSRYGLVAVARRFGTLAGLPLLAAPQPRGGAEQRDQHAEDGDLGDPVAEPRALADDARGLNRQDDDPLDRGDHPDDQERLGDQLALLHRRPDGEEQLHDDEHQQQHVEQLDHRRLRQVTGQRPRRPPGEHQQGQRGQDEEQRDAGVDDVPGEL